MKRWIRVNPALRVKCTEEVDGENCINDAIVVEIEEGEENDKIIGITNSLCLYHKTTNLYI